MENSHFSTLQWSDNFLANNFFSFFNIFEFNIKFDKGKLGENKVLTLVRMALWAPYVEWPKKRSVLAVPPLQLIQKF